MMTRLLVMRVVPVLPTEESPLHCVADSQQKSDLEKQIFAQS